MSSFSAHGPANTLPFTPPHGLAPVPLSAASQGAVARGPKGILVRPIGAVRAARRTLNGVIPNPAIHPVTWAGSRGNDDEVLPQTSPFSASQRPSTSGGLAVTSRPIPLLSAYGPGSPGAPEIASGAAASALVRAGTTQELSAHQTGQSFGVPPPAAPQEGNQFARYYVFDWDNTLCPTDWLSGLYGQNGLNLYMSKRPCPALSSPVLKSKMDLLQNSVRRLLLKCKEKGEIAIMSNATSVGLIKTLRLLPVIHRTVNELRIAVVSARDMCEPHGLPLEDWKDTALIQMLLDFAGRHVNHKLSVMTIGDQDFEHIALHNASEYLQSQFGRDPHPKCIKYVESPTIDTVTKQTSIFTELIDQFADDESGTYLMEQDSAMMDYRRHSL
ncbi:conserved hypothetical protein [Neospora caninum Liverpool]|uniref:Uncharacterized protein n=1 Tax=Neospora caninum (strain Liverpool) TaxID=572307 RepID=F0VQ90_NEOCL|nr:conserved hypothetical protein [Neospora caninum Liverpool]CBZ55887.1 conserved hypothetical protein [Neospora caninum Liverpool]CEL70630.1 TPA: hypothetical protein BN1204_063130 [Neospora caninum Liverpool]|eukprot:XP_003885913.1 conserved hypothetical protein [Neospora caninum Liverpool]